MSASYTAGRKEVLRAQSSKADFIPQIPSHTGDDDPARAEKITEFARRLSPIVTSIAYFEHDSWGSPIVAPSADWELGSDDYVGLSFTDNDGEVIPQSEFEGTSRIDWIKKIACVAFNITEEVDGRNHASGPVFIVMMPRSDSEGDIINNEGVPLTLDEIEGAEHDLSTYYEALLGERITSNTPPSQR